MTRAHPLATRQIAHAAHFTVIVVCVEAPAAHPDWQGKEWCRDDDPLMLISHNQAYLDGDLETLKGHLVDAANRIARQIIATDGGVWFGRLRDASNDPWPDRRLPMSDRRALDTHIRNGPDGPGRRVLEGMKDRPNASKLAALAERLKGVPGKEAPAPVPSKAEIGPPAPSCAVLEAIERKGQALVDTLKAPVLERPGPVMADAEFWAQKVEDDNKVAGRVGREPGEDGR